MVLRHQLLFPGATGLTGHISSIQAVMLLIMCVKSDILEEATFMDAPAVDLSFLEAGKTDRVFKF